MKTHKGLLRFIIAIVLAIYGLTGLIFVIGYLLNRISIYPINLPDDVIVLSVSIIAIVLLISGFGIFMKYRWGFYAAVMALGWDLIASLIILIMNRWLSTSMFIDMLIDWFLIVSVLYVMEN